MANTSAKTFTEYLDGSPLFALDNATGQIIPQTSELKDAWTTLIKNLFGDIDTTEETPIGRWIEAEAIRDARTCAITASYANQINPNYATGKALDAIAAFFNVQRNSATPTIITIRVSGTNGVVIPQGSRIRNKSGQEFVINNKITIENGIGEGYATSVDVGEMFIEYDSVHDIVTQIDGWSSVTNTGVYLAGSNLETDTSLRERVRNARWTGTGFTKSILSAIERVVGMRSAIVIDNGYGTDMYVVYKNGKYVLVDEHEEGQQYIKMNAHSILVVAYSAGSDFDLAKAIFNTKSAGCGYTKISNQWTTEYVDDETNGVSYPVVFNKPKEVVFGVEITVRKNQYVGSNDDLKEEIKSAIKQWAQGSVSGVDGLQIGQSIYSYEIGAAVSDTIKPIQIVNVEITHKEEQEVIGEDGEPSVDENGNKITKEVVIKSSSIELFIDKIGVVDDSENGIVINIV